MKKIFFFVIAVTLLSIFMSCDKQDDSACFCESHRDTLVVNHYDTVVVNHHDTVIINNTDDYYLRIVVDYRDSTINNDYRYGTFLLKNMYYKNEFNEIEDYLTSFEYQNTYNSTSHTIKIGPVKYGFKAWVQCIEHKAVPSALTYRYSDERVPTERNFISISVSKNREPFTTVKEGVGELTYTIE